MKILYLSNNPISNNLFYWLQDDCLEDVILFNKKVNLFMIENMKIDFIISYNYRYYIPKEIIDYLKNSIVNLHISLLPWNKGAYPNIWSFLEDTPKGVTIHYVNEEIDGGDILLQKEIYIDESRETLYSSYKLLHMEIQDLFMKNWKKIKNGEIVPKPQICKGTLHTVSDFKSIEKIIDDWDMSISELKRRYKEMVGDLYE